MFYAIANVCTHDGWPLDQGDLCGERSSVRGMVRALTSQPVRAYGCLP